ncbi:MAG: hypothetical protein HKN46_09685 [Acidimicrobiia bacterium]|nr:hypothetical protein [Acidimicrobiia bacterium]
MPHLHLPPGSEPLGAALAPAGVHHGPIADGLVFAASGPAVGDDFGAVQAELEEAFHLSRSAAREAAPMVYVVAGEDLLGQRGAPAAMVSCGLLSAARTAAIEGAKPAFSVNVVAPEQGAAPDAIATWVARFLDADGATGELLRVGPAHLGKALP